jgi:hypothetical protein
MARKIELRTGVLLANGANGPATFKWGETMANVLRYAPPQQGLVLDQVIRSMEALAPIAKAIEDQADAVTLTEEQWRTLRERIDVYPFPFADPAIAEFGLAIRNAESL